MDLIVPGIYSPDQCFLIYNLIDDNVDVEMQLETCWYVLERFHYKEKRNILETEYMEITHVIAGSRVISILKFWHLGARRQESDYLELQTYLILNRLHAQDVELCLVIIVWKIRISDEKQGRKFT